MNVMNEKSRGQHEKLMIHEIATRPNQRANFDGTIFWGHQTEMYVPNPHHKAARAAEENIKGTLHFALNTAAPSSSSSSPPATINTPPAAPPTTSSSTGGIVLFARLGFWCIVHQKGIQRQSIGQDEVPNIISSNGKSVQWLWFAVPSREFYGLEMRIHLHVNTYMDNA